MRRFSMTTALSSTWLLIAAGAVQCAYQVLELAAAAVVGAPHAPSDLLQYPHLLVNALAEEARLSAQYDGFLVHGASVGCQVVGAKN